MLQADNASMRSIAESAGRQRSTASVSAAANPLASWQLRKFGWVSYSSYSPGKSWMAMKYWTDRDSALFARMGVSGGGMGAKEK